MSFFILLTKLNIIGIVTLCGVAIVLLTVFLLVRSTRRQETEKIAKEKIYRIRAWYFTILTAVAVVALFITFGHLPYAKAAAHESKTVVSVVAYQWMWEMSEGEMPASLDEFEGTDEITVPVGENIEFIVTSNDVNHSFGVYNEAGNLVTQVQAMPGYNNVLSYTFSEKGDYKVLCMEYCGLAHAYMEATIHVE